MTKQDFYKKAYERKLYYWHKESEIVKLKKLDIPKEEYINLKMFTTKSLELPKIYKKTNNLDEADVVVLFTKNEIKDSFRSINWSECALIRTALEYNIPYLTLEDLENDDEKIEVSLDIINSFDSLRKSEDKNLIIQTLNNYKLSKNPTNIIYNLIFCTQIRSFIRNVYISDLGVLEQRLLINLEIMQSKYHVRGDIGYADLIDHNIPFDSLVGLEIEKYKLPMMHSLQSLINYVNENNLLK